MACSHKNHAWLLGTSDDRTTEPRINQSTKPGSGELQRQLPAAGAPATSRARWASWGSDDGVPRADPDGGTPSQLSTLTRMEPQGSQTSAVINVFNLRASKHFTLAGQQRVQFDLDLFNVFNTSAPITANFQAGPTFAYATAVVPPRIARLGVRYMF
jgi:outer membrane receptor protein involved in Fe transport